LKNKLPNFLIIGAQKSGTTSLFQYLKKSKEVFFPALKEPHFFTYFGVDSTKSYSLDDYISMFSEAEEGQLIGDASPSYLTSENAKKHIVEILDPKIKLIVLLRQPVERAYSNYQHALREGLERNDIFVKCFEKNEGEIFSGGFKFYREKGYYGKHLDFFYSHFNSSQILVVRADELKSNPKKIVEECCEFLCISNIQIEPHSKNEGVIPKSKLLQPILKIYYRNFARSYKSLIPDRLRVSVKKLLTQKANKLDDKLKLELTLKYYKDDILLLERLTSISFSDWLK
jgi:hypothetical protein